MPNKYTIAIDANAAVDGHKTGVGYICRQLLEHLAEATEGRAEIVAHYYNFLGLQRTSPLPKLPNVSYKVSRLLPRKVVNVLRRKSIELPFELLTKRRCDIHIFPDFLSLPSLFKTPSLGVVHDLAYIDVPESVSQKNRMTLAAGVPQTIKRCRGLVTISRATEQRLMKHYPKLMKNKPVIITYPLPEPFTGTGKLPAAVGKKTFLLFMGTLEPRKNIVGLVEAYRQLPQNLRDAYCLVLAGSPGWNAEEISQAIKKAQQDGLEVITTGYVTEGERRSLYENASVLVFPSFYEGFGIPPLEAMRAKTAVVTSNLPVLREVCGDGAQYCDPHSPRSIAQAITAVLSDHRHRSALIRAGSKQLQQFSWNKNIEALVSQIERLIPKS